MEIFFFWIVFTFIVGFIGNGKKIGFWGAFFISLLLSPIIGLIVVLVSDSKNPYTPIKPPVTNLSSADELEKLIKLRDSKSISEEEYQKLKGRILN